MAEQSKTANANGSDIPHGGTEGAEPTPTYVTSAQLNAAITARFKSFESKLDETLSKLSAPREEQQTKNDKPADETTRRIAALERQLDASRKDAETAKQRHLDTTLRTKVAEELSKVGVASPKHALALLVDAEKRIAWGEDDRLVWKGDDGIESDLSAGLKSWAKTPDARPLMAPRGTVGSGDRGAPAVNGSTPKSLTKADAARMLVAAHTGGETE
jgi:hypothetical protein